MAEKLEYRVKETTRWIVTEYHEVDGAATVSVMSESEVHEDASAVAQGLAVALRQVWETEEGSEIVGPDDVHWVLSDGEWVEATYDSVVK